MRPFANMCAWCLQDKKREIGLQAVRAVADAWPEPALELEPAAVRLPNNGTVTVTLRNPGSSTVLFELSCKSAAGWGPLPLWLEASPVRGYIRPQGTQEVTLQGSGVTVSRTRTLETVLQVHALSEHMLGGSALERCAPLTVRVRLAEQ